MVNRIKKKIKKESIIGLLKVATGFLFIFAIFHFVGANDLFSVLSQVSFGLLFLSILVEPFVILLTGLSYKVLLKTLNVNVKTLYITRLASVGYAIGFITPARIAEFGITVPLTKHGITVGEGLGMMAVDKILSTVVVLITGIIGVIILGGSNESILIIAGLVVFFLSAIVMATSKKSRQIIVKYFLKGHSEYFLEFTKTLRKLFSSPGPIFICFLFKVAKWTFSFLSVAIIFRALGHPLEVHVVGMIFSLVVIFSTIPITISGLGLKEGSGALLYNIFAGVAPAVATNAMLLSTANIFLVSIIYYTLSYKLLFSEKQIFQ